MKSTLGRNHNLLLSLTTLFCHADVGYCLLSAPSRYYFSPLRSSVVSDVVRLCMSTTDIYDGSTTDYDNNINNGYSSISSDWASSVHSETDDVIGPSVGFEETSNRATNEEKDRMSEEDIWIDNVVDEIYNAYSTLDDQPLYDTSFDEPIVDRSVADSINNDMDDEIAMLVRCNERPDSLLIEEGRAFPPLNKEEKNDVSQLVVWNEDTFEATEFLKHAVSKMFREHAAPSVKDGILSMDRAHIASWMTKSLHEEEKGKVSQHDKRVLKTLSHFSEYGSGRIVEENFQNLYFRCIVDDTSKLSALSAKRHLQLRERFRDAVWRDIRAHGILSPTEEERLLRLEKLAIHSHSSTSSSEEAEQVLFDECEILDGDYRAPEQKKVGQYEQRTSSHKLVEMANDKNTPLRIRDGDFGMLDCVYYNYD